MTVAFELDGNEFVALNGGPQFKFTGAVSFVVNCETQEEIDYYWEKLPAAGGQEIECGWLKDKYGLCWQIVPAALWEMIKDPARSHRVMHALMQMKKLDLAALREASDEIQVSSLEALQLELASGGGSRDETGQSSSRPPPRF